MSTLAPSGPIRYRGESTHAVTISQGPRFTENPSLSPKYIDSRHLTGHFAKPLREVYVKLRSMENWEDGWNGYAAQAPTTRSLDNARKWITFMYSEVVFSGKPWRDPFVSADVDGEVLFEWRAKTKDLSIYIEGNEITFIKDLGPEVGSEMVDGDASTPKTRRELWAWFTE